ncbi:hypothetical protein Ahy_B10g102091 [Arachis hypogaea]|uniref:Uncharacterized protein n=1 Tax=Arachis hypogaea TaxID=3818 RepID=A0A444X164_ARAHY|nr:hypothetical protein Ahy_B10g102091 [Arachis hypogaea]
MGEENKVVGEGEKKKEESVGATAVVGDGEEEKNKKKNKSKKQGLISRIWNGIFRRRSDDFEKRLQYISKEEAAVMARVNRRNRSWRRTSRQIIIISVIFEVLLELPSSKGEAIDDVRPRIFENSSSCKLLERKKETGVGNELRGKEEGRFAGVEREGSSQCRRRPHRVAPPRQSTRPCHRREPPCRRHHEAADLVRVRERSERGGGQRSRRARHCADSSREELVPSPIILAQHQRQNRDLKRARAITTDGEGGASAEKVKSPLSPAPPSRVTAERAVTSVVASLVCSAVVPLRRRPSSHTEQER